MKGGLKGLMFSLLAGGLMLIPLFLVDCTKVSYNQGDMVAAKWNDGKWYIAKINACKSDACTTEFHDGTAVDLKFADLKAIPGKLEVKNGDKVWAVWPTTNAFHDGTVMEIKDNGATVSWDEGGTPSFVEYGRMMKK